jgi:hypothetical protein
MQQDSQLAKLIKLCALLGSLLCALFALLYHFFKNDIVLALAITAGTTAYHFLMRLAVGWLVSFTARDHFDPNNFWFRQRPFERRLYRTLRIRRWKDKMPTYDPRKFSLEQNTPEQIIQNSCEAELVHEIIIVASFFPLFAALLWGALPAFLITSLLAAALDCCFVMMQRYNRPRLQQYHKRVTTTERRQRS